jgi:prefoldin subunit 5
MALAGVLAAGLCGCPKKPAPPPPPKHAADKVWTPEEMAQDPEGYLRWADAKVQAQAAQCDTRLRTLQDRLDQVRSRQADLKQKMDDARNIHDRMEQALRRSEDEDRLPVRMGGRSFTTEEGRQIVAQSLQWIQDRQSLERAYDEAVAKLQSAAADLRAKIDAMGRLRERLALDIEKVGIDRSVAELERLSQTQAEIGGFSKALTSSEETIGLSNLPPADKEAAKVDIDSFLKK